MKRYVIKRIKDGKYWTEESIKFTNDLWHASTFRIIPEVDDGEIAVEVEIKEKK